MTTSPSLSIERRIRDIHEELTENEHRLADVILAAPGEIATHNAAEIAALAGVSPPTTTRFFQKLGYETYEQARRQARDAQKSGSPLYLRRLEPKATELQKLVHAHLDNELANLANTFHALDLKTLPAIVAKMATARRVACIGYRHSQPIASMFYRHLLSVRGDVHLLPAAGDTLAESLCDFGPQDMAICIGLRRRIPQLSAAMEGLASMRVPMLYVSDVIIGKAGKMARWVIRCHTEGHMMFDSVAAVAGVSNFLYTLVGREISRTRSAHLERVERMHEMLGELE